MFHNHIAQLAILYLLNNTALFMMNKGIKEAIDMFIVSVLTCGSQTCTDEEGTLQAMDRAEENGTYIFRMSG